MPQSPAQPLSIPDGIRIGECTVDVPLREITAPGARHPLRVTPKSMAVLLVLVENAGRVVTRDTLIARVWPGTLPTDDVLTQAVTQLRKAFGEKRGSTRYIETIAKSGYRLRASVQAHPAVGQSTDAYDSAVASLAATIDGVVVQGARVAPYAGMSAPQAADRSPATQAGDPRLPWRPPFLWVAVLVLMLLGTALGAWLLQRGAAGHRDAGGDSRAIPAVPERPFLMITSAPGYELSPTLSPDGAMVAYTATLPDRLGTVILVQTTAQAVPRPLTLPPDGLSDRLPAWSPDGRSIAFSRRDGANECQIMVAAANGGGERRVGVCDGLDDLGFDWTPDGRGLVFGSMTHQGRTTGIRILDLATGEWRSLAYGFDGRDLDTGPRYSPDGRWIAFVRNPQFGDLWQVPAAGGQPQRLTFESGEMRGWDWLPEGNALVFARRINSETRLYRLNLSSGRVEDLGLEDAQSPDVAANNAVMAFVRRRPGFEIFRIDPNSAGAGRGDLPKPLFASTGRDSHPAIAPDGRQLVFASDRSGHFHLWWGDVERPESLRLIDGVHPEAQRMPEWSPDSRQLLAIGTDHAGRRGLFEVTANSGQVALLPVPLARPTQGLYLSDGGRILVGGPGSNGRVGLYLYDRTTAPWRQLAFLEDVSLAKVDAARGRVLFTRFSGDGLWSTDPALSPRSVRRIVKGLPRRWLYRNWTVAADGAIEYVDQSVGCRSRLRRLVEGGDATSERCLHPSLLASVAGFSADPWRNAVYVALAANDGTDIALRRLEVAEASIED